MIDDGFVFGYGSLLRSYGDVARPGHLEGYRRRWGVATDNSRTLPGYKYYLTVPGNERPGVFVTFLDLIADPAQTVNGVLIPVTAATLARLDRRERNYERHEVTDQVREPIDRPVWTYLGSDDARRRFERGHSEGRAVINAGYHRSVLDGFASLGPQALAAFHASTDAPPCPMVELTRVDT